jgi:hypothetical protein
LLIVVHDKDLKLTDSEPTEVQHLEMETCPVQVNVVSDPPCHTLILPHTFFFIIIIDHFAPHFLFIPILPL